MGVLTDIVVADDTEAPAVAAAAVPSERWPGIDMKGVDEFMLALLWAELSHQASGPELETAFTALHAASEEGPWVSRVPKPFVRLLAQSDDTAAASAARALLAHAEFETWELHEVREVVDGLRALAREAVRTGKSLILWVCL